ncbi:MAG: ATP-binding protein [Spirochaetota bacterium]|nr:ATP-binding protein [Spirochaetota bacterium]
MFLPYHRILYVDDEKANLKTFEIAFKRDYEVITSTSPLEALEIISQSKEIPMIISDQRMPEMSGIDFLEQTIKLSPDSIRILLTAYTEKEDMLNAINMGKVYSYIVKPWDMDDVQRIIKDGFEKYLLIKENKYLVDELQEKMRQLEEAQEMLINQEKRAVVGSLAAGLVHEVKNQLNTITFLEIIMNKLTEEEKNYVNIIFESRNRIVNMIDEVRGLAKNEETHYEIMAQDLGKIINDSLLLVQMDEEVRGISLDFEDRLTKPVKVNKDKIIQVLLNLIRNAAQAVAGVEDGKVTVMAEEEDHKAIIRVLDNGVGIDSEKLSQIWEPFFTTKGERGTGIGLDIVKRIIEGHGGSISCTSQPRKETAFVITLPMGI